MKRAYVVISIGAVGLMGFSVAAKAQSVGNYFLVITGDIRTPLSKDEAVTCAVSAYLLPGAAPSAIGSGPNSAQQRATVSDDGKRYACQIVVPYVHPVPPGGRQLVVSYSVTRALPNAGAALSSAAPKQTVKELRVPAVPAGPQLLPPVVEDL